ncbi:MAG TPA: hypothetical protein VFU23_14755 [Gemmatimonadales bacterium]|nr:hypothetical protein [Gemmatimonadales bacterium]
MSEARASMTTAYRFHPGTRLALLQGTGLLSLDHWESNAKAALGHPGWQGTRRILSDRRRMTGTFPPGMEDRVLAFFRANAEALGDVQWAVVVPEVKAAFDTVRVAAELSKGTRVRVQGFTDLAVALQWLLGAYQEVQITSLIQWIDANQ